jgi:TPR repeat protein
LRLNRIRLAGLLAAAVLLIAVASFFLIRKTCCSEDLDPEQIRKLEQAATNGDVAAMMRLYRYFDEGEEPEKAMMWLRRAADAGDGTAGLHMYSRLRGSDDPEQNRVAVAYLHRSAERGYPTAQNVLGKLYRDGAGVPRNEETANDWFLKGARGGNIDAILTVCDKAAAERDIDQCRECLVLADRALPSTASGSYYAVNLEEQRERLQRVVNEPAAAARP